MELSILVCTVTNRVNNFLPIIIKKLEKQAEGKEVEILYLGDNRKRSIGTKRNDLLLLSTGKYACFVDDDDDISDDYIDMILQAIKDNPDVIVFKALYTDKKHDIQKEVKYSCEYQVDGEDKDYFYRLPNHLMVFKHEILQNIWFKEINFGEDFDFAKQIKPYCRKQASITKVLYYYNYDENLSESRK